MVERALAILAHYGVLDGGALVSAEIKILCPFHAEDRPSCGVSLDKGVFYCHGCGVGGTLLDFVKRLENVDDLEALRLMRRIEVGQDIEIPERAKSILAREPVDDETARRQSRDFFVSLPRPKWRDIARHYLYERGFEARTLERFDVRINASADYPVIFPVQDGGVFQGYMTRALDDRPDKYRMSPGMRKTQVLDGRVRPGAAVLLVEGKLDRMRAWQNGCADGVTGLNWSLSDEQLTKLEPAGAVICALDNDAAGAAGYRALKEKLQGKTQTVRFPFPSWIKDVGEMQKPEFDVAMRLALRKIA